MTPPAAMRCIEIARPGGPEELRSIEAQTPRPGPGEVLIEIEAAGVNRPDCLQRAGVYPSPRGASPLPGLEASGRVVARGEGADRFAIGAPVCALLNGGGYAEYAVAPEGQTLPAPEGLSLEEAGGVPETFFTVHSNVFERGSLRPGETFLVHGGASGVGASAIQLARSFGAEVYCTVSSREKAEFCQGLGARRAIVREEEDFVAAMREATGGRGVDVLLDIAGGDWVQRNLDAMAPDGRIVQIAWLRGARASADFTKLMTKRLTWTGSTLRPRDAAYKADVARALEETVWPRFATGELSVPIAARFPLERACDAHLLMESNAHMGKILLTPKASHAS